MAFRNGWLLGTSSPSEGPKTRKKCCWSSIGLVLVILGLLAVSATISFCIRVARASRWVALRLFFQGLMQEVYWMTLTPPPLQH